MKTWTAKSCILRVFGVLAIYQVLAQRHSSHANLKPEHQGSFKMHPLDGHDLRVFFDMSVLTCQSV